MPQIPACSPDACSFAHRSQAHGHGTLFLSQRSMRTMSYADKTITCRDCGMDFVFTSGEQEFYAQKGFTNEPTRCASCRQARKAGGGGRSGGRDSYSSGGYDDNYGGGSSRGGYSSGPREMHSATCAS